MKDQEPEKDAAKVDSSLSLPGMLGKKRFDGLVAMAESLVTERNKAAVQAVQLIPDDADDDAVDAWLLAGLFCLATNGDQRKDGELAKFVTDVSSGFREWWKKSQAYDAVGSACGISDLSHREMGVLAMQAASCGSPKTEKEKQPDYAAAKSVRADYKAGKLTRKEAADKLRSLGFE
jgi:hypothetical protein